MQRLCLHALRQVAMRLQAIPKLRRSGHKILLSPAQQVIVQHQAKDGSVIGNYSVAVELPRPPSATAMAILQRKVLKRSPGIGVRFKRPTRESLPILTGPVDARHGTHFFHSQIAWQGVIDDEAADFCSLLFALNGLFRARLCRKRHPTPTCQPSTPVLRWARFWSELPLLGPRGCSQAHH